MRRAEGVESPCPGFSFGVAQCPQEATEFDKLVELGTANPEQAEDYLKAIYELQRDGATAATDPDCKASDQ